MKKFLVNYPTMERLAGKVIATANVGAFSGQVTKADIAWKTFPDGTPKLFVPDVADLRGAHVIFLMDPDLAKIFPQYAMIRMLARSGPAKITVILPYFASGTMDRVEEEGEVATAIGHARLLSSLPGTDSHKTTIAIVDIHNLSERGFFTDDVALDLLSAVPHRDLVHADGERMREDAVILFPDDGALKRYRRSFPKRDVAWCDKLRRDGKVVSLTLAGGADLRGREVLIVDDLVQSGTTLVMAAEAAHRAGATSVSAFVTHGVLPGNARHRFTAEHFRTVWITDSIPRPEDFWTGNVQRTASISRLLAKYILGL